MKQPREQRTVAGKKPVLLTFFFSLLGMTAQADDAEYVHVPSREEMKTWLDNYETHGWIYFLAEPERQIISFVQLQSMRCHLSEIRYSINSAALDQRFPVGKCNPYLPTELMDDDRFNYVILEPGTAKTVAVQVIWDNQQSSAILLHKLCDKPGEIACSVTSKLYLPEGPQQASPAQPEER